MKDDYYSSKSALLGSKISGVIYSILGWFFAVFFFIFLMIVISGNGSLSDRDMPGALVTGSIPFVSGILLILHGSGISRRIKRFKRYLQIILAGNEKSIEKIAAATGRSTGFVMRDLQAMINKKFFLDAHINTYSGEILLGNMSYERVYQTVQAFSFKAESAAPEPEYAVAACKGCGAVNRIAKGAAGKCEFCGSPLNAG